MEKKCEHIQKAYKTLFTSLTCDPPINISYWICKDCGFEGSESHQYDPDREYRETKQKFENDTQNPGKKHWVYEDVWITDEEARRAIETVKNGKVVGEVGTLLTTPCGKPHNNGEDTCVECEVIKQGV